jgi:hypothetical protein
VGFADPRSSLGPLIEPNIVVNEEKKKSKIKEKRQKSTTTMVEGARP